MSVDGAVTGPFCTALGCRSHADQVVDHPDHGERPVCTDCASDIDGETVRWLA